MKAFNHVYAEALQKAGLPPRHRAEGECRSAHGTSCQLCHAVHLSYADEVRLKNAALQKFWKTLRLPISLQPLVASPRGRAYRTTTKRKVFRNREGVRLGLIDPVNDDGARSFEPVLCAIESVEHCQVYSTIQAALQKPYTEILQETLRYVIIKGNYRECSVIFNVRSASPAVLRSVNTLSKTLTAKHAYVVGVFLYRDESSDRYYMGSRNPSRTPHIAKIHGKAEIYHRTCAKSFLYPPASFSQVNLSLLDIFVQKVSRLLAPNRNMRLFDFYCGYGLFSLCLADKVQQATGVDQSPLSVQSAMANAKRQHTRNAQFIRSSITAESIADLMGFAEHPFIAILDPPRKGTQPGVIEMIAHRKPENVVHIFCAIDLMSDELARWRAAHYELAQAVPLDMFPGTGAVETVILLRPRH